MGFKWGSCNLSKKKNVANVIRALVFASVPISVFLVAASKTDVASKTDFWLLGIPKTEGYVF